MAIALLLPPQIQQVGEARLVVLDKVEVVATATEAVAAKAVTAQAAATGATTTTYARTKALASGASTTPAPKGIPPMTF
ncbi:hypothetical protein C2845_PM17G05120 [Panicum miliaceum]|uniref:Uncharacterized protein n=1 Tax=Panicum miliaceum TaxID=4540 RepID=A0A3L6Q0D6_PANMI|nr:hypothetical protein C2845_PM17G05120 [Panicum miliaceum]